jgi:hypothetical protein
MPKKRGMLKAEKVRSQLPHTAGAQLHFLTQSDL